ncbi:FecR family protein [Flagellimonas myxillae]|uniref:FecR family protein n=1 Tax=Flagellimonas myxillae TaxID=2942214 RepID=UPI00201F3A6D|nr:FecR domain-containing protein [Muricauda myxillae]MCL6266304.1 FecR domain-containing protein [Muricauda myxillae]
MNDFNKYLDDEKFVDWIVDPTDEKNAYWETYISQNPEEEGKIKILRQYLGALQATNDKLSQNEKQEILDRIYDKVVLAKSGQGPIYLNFLKYAAIFLVLVGTAYYLTIESSEKENVNIDSLLQVAIDSVTDTKLILENDQEIAIDEKRSIINYSGNNNLVINKKDTLDISAGTAVEEVQMNQLIVPFGKHSKITLSDGSIVHVNSGSRLVFPKKFLGDSREVYLDGEAFFEVESDASRPFTVKVLKDEAFSVTAVGTKFNVNSYGKNDRVTTVLAEGEVHLVNKAKNSLFGKDKKTIMQPGELVEWSVSAKAVQSKMQVDTEIYISWTKGLLIFRGERLKDVVKRVEDYYNIEIELAESINEEFRLTGKLDLNDTMEETMENLAVSASAKYEKNGVNGYLITK